MTGKYLFICVIHFTAIALALNILGFILPEVLTSYYISIVNFLTLLFISLLTFKFTKSRYLGEKVNPGNRSVLITGCDSGFGHRLAKRLDSRGFQVFASCLFPSGAGAEVLRKDCSKRLKVLELNVTQDESVKKAVEFVKENLGVSELWAIVNNAGLHKGFSLEFSSMDDFQECMDINAIGTVRVTKAFLPLLRQSKGRVVNVTSLVGRAVTPLTTAYSMSKFAAWAFTGCLRQEFAAWGISVVSVEPELFQTPFADKESVNVRLNASIDATEKSIRADYGEAYVTALKKFTNVILYLASPKVELVINDLESAITLKYPDREYRTRRNYFSRFIFYCYQLMPNNLQDLMAKIVLYMFNFSKIRKQ